MIEIEQNPYGNNTVVIRDGYTAAYFSYGTIIALIMDNQSYKTTTKFSKTTSKHLNAIPLYEPIPVPQAELEAMWNRAVITFNPQ